MFRLYASGLALILAAATFPALAQDTPTQLKGGRVVTADEATKLIDGKSATFVDTRSVVNFGKGHVPGSISAAYKERSDKVADFDSSKDELDFGKIPANKSVPVVFYSDGPSGWKSYKAAVLAIKQGYTNVMYMRGGFAEWTDRKLPVER